MSRPSLSHLSDRELLDALAKLVAQDRVTTAAMLFHLVEVEARKLHVRAGHSSLHLYCVHELRLSWDAAYKRIQAARLARRFPVLLEAVADGRLHLTGVNLLAPWLSTANAAEMIAAATWKTKSEIEQMLAERFPQTESMPLVVELPERSELAPAQVRVSETPLDTAPLASSSAASVASPVATPAAPTRPTHSKLAPIAAKRFVLQLSMAQSTHDKLRHAQDLLSHQLPSGDLAEVLDRALDALIRTLEKRKFAATDKPRAVRAISKNSRTIPAHVRRAVKERDGGRCTFVSEDGRRCDSRKFLEYDHVEPVARGGTSTLENLRLRCRAHNQYEAECTFGAGFMQEKRERWGNRLGAVDRQLPVRSASSARPSASSLE